MNPVQKDILRKLIINTEQKHSELKSAEVDPKLFMYHLNKLIDDGLVEKKDDGMYRLTAKGQLFVEKLNGRNLQPQLQPRVATMLIIKNERDEYLLYHRSIEPFKNKVGFPWGKVHIDETLSTAAKRELHEWTGIEDIALEKSGVVDMIIYKENELMSHTIFHIFKGQSKSQSIKEKTFWQPISESDDLSDEKYLMWFNDLFKFDQENNSYKELIYQV